MATYDEAIFYQKLKALAQFSTVTLEDVETAFWAAAADLEYSVQQHCPEKWPQVVETARTEIVPLLAHYLEPQGLRLRST